MVKFSINDMEMQVEDGTTILEAALDAGIKIPHLCYHEELTPYGACRLCLVEVMAGAKAGLRASCVCEVTEGLVVRTDTSRVLQARKIMFELLLAGHPDAEKIRSLAEEYGVTQTRISRKQTKDCILCGLCLRACSEIAGMQCISFIGRGASRRVRTPFNAISETCIGCGACAYLCPTGTIKVEEADV